MIVCGDLVRALDGRLRCLPVGEDGQGPLEGRRFRRFRLGRGFREAHRESHRGRPGHVGAADPINVGPMPSVANLAMAVALVSAVCTIGV